MMKFTGKSIFLLSALCILFTAGCKQSPLDPENISPEPLAPTNLTATVMNDSTIRVAWEASSTPADSILYYVLSVTGNDDLTLTKDYSFFDVSGLKMESIYTFELRAKGINHKMSTPATVQEAITTFRPEPPSSLRANSSDAAIMLKWNPPSDFDSPDFNGYRLIITPTGEASMPAIILDKTATTYNATDLTNGVLYTFSLQSLNISNITSVPTLLQWAPAQRFKNIRLYETASSMFGAGLNLARGGNVLLSQGEQWDIGLDTRPDNGVPSYDIGSPNLLTYTFPGTTRKTFVSARRYENVISIDDVFDTDALGSTSAYMKPETERRITFTTVKVGFVFFLKTIEGNYAKIFVKAVDGNILRGTAPNRYIEMDISYQTVANIPYALTHKDSGKSTIQNIVSPFKIVENSPFKKGK